jgi:hypothetical protein
VGSLVNAGMFAVEIAAGVAAGSASLQARLLEFLGDSANYAISLLVVGMALRYRASAALAKGATMAAHWPASRGPSEATVIRRTLVTVLFLSLYLPAQVRAEDKEPLALVELGAATERSIQENGSSFGPTAAVEFPVIKDWLEIEVGISPLFRPGQTEWQADFLFKKPFTLSDKVEFMIGAGPQVSYAAFGGGTKIAGEVELEWMIWPSSDRKLGWFVAPTYSYSFSKGHEQSLGFATGLIIPIR